MRNRGLLNFRKKELIGLDVDSSSVRMIQMRRKGGQYVVTGAAMSDIAPWDDDPERHRTHTAEAVHQCLETVNTRNRLAVCGLRGPEVVVRGFEFPLLPSEEIDGAVQLEASQTCPFSTDDSALDYQVTSEKERTRGFWVAATNSLIANKRKLTHETGLKCVLMDIDGLALLNGLQGLAPEPPAPVNEESDEDRDDLRPALVSIGDSFTSIAIVDYAQRPFVRDVYSGEQDIIRQMIRTTKLSAEAVRDALYGDGPVDEEIHQQGLEKACSQLLDSIATTLRYYIAENRLARVSKVLVSGRLALADSFIDLLARKLSMETVAWNPVAGLPCEADEKCQSLLQESGPAVAVAAGLAMRTI